jgi:hypothetical protein
LIAFHLQREAHGFADALLIVNDQDIVATHQSAPVV